MKHHKPGLRTAGTHPTLIGHRATGEPIYLAAGGNGVSAAPDDDDAERALFGERDDEDDDERDDDDDEDDDGDPDVVPVARSTWEQMQQDLARQRGANSQGGRLARTLRDNGLSLEDAYAKLGLDPKTGKLIEPEGEPEEKPEEKPETPAEPAKGLSPEEIEKTVKTAVEKAVEREVTRAVAATEKRFMGPLKALAVKSALVDADWSGKDLSRVLKMISDDDIDVTEDGDVIGVVEQIEEIKDEFPEWFRGRKPAPVVRGAADLDGGERTPPKKTMSWKERAAARLDGKAS